MTIKSMTGFSRTEGAMGPLNWHWEVRSVNGRGLDIRTRVPPGFEGLEPRVREAATKRVNRGSISITLAIKRTQGVSELRVNEKALDQILAAVDRLRERLPLSPPSAEGLLNVKGLIELVEPEESESEAQARTDSMLSDLMAALDGMIRYRQDEGDRLNAIVSDQLSAIETLVKGIERSPARAPDAVRQRLKQQVERLMETGSAFDEARLHQEAMLLATRADIEEELKRLGTHIAAARDLLKSEEAVGRKFDFLAQEFNREANTLCSKSNDTEITRAGLELKAIIDQMREQVQNIE
jgi:uncharacterized protein (TIGR00255 family)